MTAAALHPTDRPGRLLAYAVAAELADRGPTDPREAAASRREAREITRCRRAVAAYRAAAAVRDLLKETTNGR